jgi:hypothetical protein
MYWASAIPEECQHHFSGIADAYEQNFIGFGELEY